MKNCKKLVRVIFYCVAFSGSVVLTGCGHGHSHHSSDHSDHSSSQSNSHGSQPNSHGSQPSSHGAQSSSHGVHSHGHSNSDSHVSHGGIRTTLFDSTDKKVGHVELKLHDDKGDLELWLTMLPNNTPFDIPLNSRIRVAFLEMGKKEVSLSARNKVDNEDENGKANIRNGKTNYFIFPGDTQESASFLVGKSFSSEVLVYFVLDGKLFKTTSFILKPHTH